MKIFDLYEKKEYINEYVELCIKEWGDNPDTNLDNRISNKVKKILSGNYDKLICALVLIDNSILIGFISLFKYDGEERQDLTPWYATMYIKKEYRGKGYSKLLNNALIEKAKKLAYDGVYLKSNLINYYEKFGAKKIDKLNNGETLYYIKI